MRFVLYPICRNILALTNKFEFSDQNITAENYDHWVEYLNRTSPDDLATVELKPCVLQTFLDQVNIHLLLISLKPWLLSAFTSLFLP